MSTQRIKQQPAFDSLNLLGEVGGFLGLLLGASVLTVCEILDFVVVSVIGACRKTGENRKLHDSTRQRAQTSNLNQF